MSAGEKRRLTILGAIFGVLLAVFVAKTFLVHSGTSAPTAASGTSLTSEASSRKAAAKAHAKAHAKATAKKTTTSNDAPPDTFQVYATKNPFEPVIQVDVPTTTGGGTATTTPAGGTTTSTTPSNNPGSGQTVALLDVFRDTDGTVKARVQVGSTVYTVSAGQSFANDTYRVVSLDEPCGQFLFGDSPFRLCEGEQTIK